MEILAFEWVTCTQFATRINQTVCPNYSLHIHWNNLGFLGLNHRKIAIIVSGSTKVSIEWENSCKRWKKKYLLSNFTKKKIFFYMAVYIYIRKEKNSIFNQPK